MDVRYVIVAASLLVAAASLLITAYTLVQMAELSRRLNELRGALDEIERIRLELLERIRELERSLQQEGAWRPAISSEVRAVAYILPSRACTSYWRERYNDRIYFYVHSNLSEYRSLIEEDFRVISLVYDTVMVVVPADDTQLYFNNLRVIDEVAAGSGLRVMWTLLPKWKYGGEDEYLAPGTRMNRLVLEVMEYLSGLESTWRIAVWYGWTYRLSAEDILRFYESLPQRLKPLYAAWIDQPFVEVARALAERGPPFLVVTELYSEDALSAYSNLLPQQMIVTGHRGARNPHDWLAGISRKIRLISGANRLLGIWIFYDIGDGHNEEYAAYRPEWMAIPDPYRMRVVTVPAAP